MHKVKNVARSLLLLCLLALLALPLTANADDDVVFASVRLYDGIEPADQSEIARRTAAGFLPIMRGSEGFVGYFMMPADDKLAAISLFDSPEQAAASNEAARDFVVENLAPLLPNPPTVHEGTVELQLRGDMMQVMPGSLYASLRVYADFDMAHFDEANELAKSEFVPDLLAIDGFFGQYTVATTGSAVVAISIYDSPAAAAQANDSAVAFSREHLAPWSAGDPTGFSGNLAVAALADTQDGANLIASEVFASIRVYEGINPADQAEILQRTNAGFLPIMRGSAGFVGYYLMPAGDTLAAVSLFESPEQAAAATEAARDFVAENLAMLLPNPPTVVEGALDVFFLVDETEMPAESMSSLYASLRVYSNYDMSDHESTVALVVDEFLPLQQTMQGFFGYMTMTDGAGRLAAMSIYDSEESALDANDVAAVFVAGRLAELLPDDPARINGQLGIAALAAIDMGANLIDMMGEA